MKKVIILQNWKIFGNKRMKLLLHMSQTLPPIQLYVQNCSALSLNVEYGQVLQYFAINVTVLFLTVSI